MRITRLTACLALAAAAAIGAAYAQAVAVPPSSPGDIAFMEMRNWQWAEAKLLLIAIPAFFLFTGLGARLSGMCDRVTGGRRLRTVTLFAVVYIVLSAAIMLPFEYYRDYVSLLGTDMASAGLSQWALQETVPLIAKIVVAGLFVWIPYALIARSPKRWWLYAAAALVPVAFLVLVVLPVWVDPLTTDYKPLEDHALYSQIENYAARCGVENIPVFVGGDEDTVVGLGPTKRVILNKDIWKSETPDQIRFTVGHELKHYVEGDNYKALAVIALLPLGVFWLTDRAGRALLKRYAGRFGFSSLADPASLPLFMLMLALSWLFVTPVFNLYARHIEHEADRFSLELTHENHAMGTMFATFITRDHEVADWDTFFRIFRATHPSNAERIRFANSYHPWLEGKPLKYGDVCRPARR